MPKASNRSGSAKELGTDDGGFQDSVREYEEGSIHTVRVVCFYCGNVREVPTDFLEGAASGYFTCINCGHVTLHGPAQVSE
jgi:hypothetical protein